MAESGLDPSLILAASPPAPAFSVDAALDSAAKIEDLRAQAVQRQAAADNLKAQAQARIQAAKDQSDVQAAVTAAGGDPHAALPGLYQVNLRAAEALQKSLDDQDAAHAKAYQTQLENINTGATAASKLSELVKPDGSNWALLAPAIAATMPEQARGTVPQNFDPAFLDQLKRYALDAQQHADQQQKSVEFWLNGNQQAAIANDLVQAGADPQARAAVFQRYQALHADPAILSRFASVTDPKALQDLITTPEQKSTMANAAAERAQAATNAIETARHNRADEATSALNARTNQAQAAQATTAAGAAGAPSDAVSAYETDLKTGNIAITAVPAAGGMRNAVIAQLRKDGYDLSRPLTAQTQARTEFAKAVLPQVGEVRDLAGQLNQMGLMGTVGGRWRDLVSGESSASALSGLTDAQKRTVGRFATQAGLLLSGMAMAHGGARGGGSAQIVEQMRTLLDPKGKDLQTFLGNLDAAQGVLSGYADLAPSPQGASAPAAGASPKAAYTYDPASGKLVKR